jgi:transposase-like protein
LGVSNWALRCWGKAFRESGHLLPKGQVVPIAEELKAARRELAQLPQENEISEEAAAYFAKESL